MKAMEFTKGFFNLELPTTSNFQRDRSSLAKTAEQDQQEEGDVEEEDDQELEGVTDPWILELQSQGYPELEREAEEFLADSQLVDKVALSPSLLGSKKDDSRAITKPKTPSALEPIKPDFSGKGRGKKLLGRRVKLTWPF